MGWVVDHNLDDTRYTAADWRRFCADHNLDCRIAPLPPDLPGLILGDTIVINAGMSGIERAYQAWHEIGHWLCHVGDFRFLRRLPCGRMILGKQERRATEFALCYPVWDPDEADQIARERGLAYV